MHIPKHGHQGQEGPHIGVAAPVYGGISFGMSGSLTQPTKPTQATEKPTQPTKPTQVTEKPTQPTKPKPQPTKPTQATEKPTQPTKPKPQPTEATQVTKATQAAKKPDTAKPEPQPTKATQAAKAAQADKTQNFVPTGNTGSITPSVTDSKIAGPATQPAQTSAPQLHYNGGEKKHIRKRDLQRDLDKCKKEALKLGKGSKAAQKKALKNLKKKTAKYMKDLDEFDIWKKWGKQPKNLNKNMKKVPNYKNMSKREILKDLQSTRAEVNKLEFGSEKHQAKILAEVKKRSAKYKKAVDNYKFGKGKGKGKRKTTKAHKSKGKRGPIKDGERVKVNGRLHYDSWGAKPGMTEHNATMKISHIAKGREYPVHVSTLKGLRQGWVKADEVTPIDGKSAKKGATVKVNKSKAKKGHTVYASIPNEPGSTSPQASLQY